LQPVFERSPDQELLTETTRKFLEAEAPPTVLRALADSDAGYEPDLWRRGAELGWSSLVVPEASGGGSVSESGVFDLMLVAYEFGSHAAPGPLLPVNVVAAALGRWGSKAQQGDVLQSILAGESVAAWALAEPAPGDGLGQVELQAVSDGGSIVLTGVKSPVEAARQADHFLVTARHESGLSQFLVPRETPGVRVTPLRSLDMTRRFARVDFDGVHLPPDAVVGELGAAAPAVDWLTDLAVVIQVAEIVGAMQWSFDTTLEWSFNRLSFGRPLASYQEIKHRFADMKMWLEASYAITDAAARAVEGDADDRSLVVSAAKSYVGRNGAELLQDCVQLHGGIGVTFDHDLHLFLRRVTTNVPLFGTPAQHAVRISRILEALEGAR
jgi:alkylation response protein AidB-like acyl-CoA dehydrogenase